MLIYLLVFRETLITVESVESIIGVLMCGISGSLLFAIVTRLTSRNGRSSWKEDRTSVPSPP